MSNKVHVDSRAGVPGRGMFRLILHRARTPGRDAEGQVSACVGKQRLNGGYARNRLEVLVGRLRLNDAKRLRRLSGGYARNRLEVLVDCLRLDSANCTIGGAVCASTVQIVALSR